MQVEIVTEVMQQAGIKPVPVLVVLACLTARQADHNSTQEPGSNRINTVPFKRRAISLASPRSM
jgi:hypothetical protein